MPNPFVVGPPVRRRQLCGRDVELGRRRLSASMFEDGRYQWTATQAERGDVVLSIENEGAPDVEYREAELLPQ